MPEATTATSRTKPPSRNRRSSRPTHRRRLSFRAIFLPRNERLEFKYLDTQEGTCAQSVGRQQCEAYRRDEMIWARGQGLELVRASSLCAKRAWEQMSNHFAPAIMPVPRTIGACRGITPFDGGRFEVPGPSRTDGMSGRYPS